ncbi:uncharacterized protein A4U43_C03F2160 [Asparagus officinalis]|uniref:OCRE domain-containing protein n=1 Tax=Asparagus officinalis TaxID=4686 RepID=A0A5P1FB44_ASPOF|nr:CD2 antigen cytoplasmic tail-binding protein 2 homolog [Asparagus officinalis]ONK74039.1 uncharacterized protein A4U43_C03F2160 [Asparagus officinalis]
MSERAKGKRPLVDDEDGDSHSAMEKKVRFPKGKKAKRGEGDGVVHRRDDEDEDLDAVVDPRLAAKERAKRRSQIREEELFRDQQADVSAAEVYYDENTKFEDDGIEIEPFNLKQEREEGYFDASGNYVEYVGQNQIKDAWLDNVVVDSTYAEKIPKTTIQNEEYQDLSSEDIGKIKRSIANVLQPGETIIQALKRLKGTSSDKRGKMSEGTKLMFDQLTEDAMKLMENGEYNVYHEEREIFEQEAEGYERIARARRGIFSTAEDDSKKHGEDISSNATGYEADGSSLLDRPLGTSEANTSLQVPSSKDGDQLDMFGDDEDNTTVNLQSNGTGLSSGSSPEQFPQPTLESLDYSQNFYSGETATGVESDFIYDQSSGYYYSSGLGYYYDPTSKLYCCATSGKWYSFNEQTGEYVEFQNADAPSTES